MTESASTVFDTTIRNLCEAFIAERYATELEYVPLLWDSLRSRNKRDSPEQLSKSCAGLSFAADQDTPLAAPFVLLTLEATLRELSDRGLEPDVTKISHAVQSAAEALGASTRLVAELVQDLPPRLVVLFSANKGAMSLASPKVADGSRPDQIYIDRRVDGYSRKNGWAGKKVLLENRKNERYDIVIDEIARELLIRKDRSLDDEQQPEPIQIDEIDPPVATMLWFVLQYIGRTIGFKDLRNGLNLLPDGAQDNSIHKAKSALSKLLGKRISKNVFGKALRQRYTIRGDSVNYCWMRKTENPQESELLYRAGMPDEKPAS